MILRIKLSTHRTILTFGPLFWGFMLLMSNCNPRVSEDSSDYKVLDAYFAQQFPNDEPGGAILVMRNDSVIFSNGYGLANMVTKEPITTTTLFNLGSITKTFVANSILMLHEQGKLSIEDSLFRFFPEFKNKAIAQKVKIKHLLTHTSGLPDSRHVSDNNEFYLTAKDQENWNPILNTDTLLFEPGSEFEYSNPAFNGLALIIEKVSGMKWQKFVRKNIFEPSKMKMSTITDGSHPESGVSHAYVRGPGKWDELDYGEEPTFPAAGNGGVWSSVEELARYEQALQSAVFMSKNRIDDSRTIKRFNNWKGTRPFASDWSWFKPQVDKGIFQPFIGWSWFITRNSTGLQVIGHTGTQGGFVCNYVTIPEKKILIVILCNTPRDLLVYTDKIISQITD
ncbi:MAG: serine hydrolase domain-containing protein [Chryseolinea sp.]